MTTIIGGIIALVLIFVLGLFATKRYGPRTRIDIFNTDDLLSAGILGFLFGIIFLPFYLVYNWIWPTVPLPVEGDDPVWGRNVNQKVAEAVFLSMQEAKLKRDPKIARDSLSKEPELDLKRECADLISRREKYAEQDIKINAINLSKERIEKEQIGASEYVWYYFDAAIHGTMINAIISEKDGRITAGSPDPIDFDVYMKFRGLPGDPFRGWVMMALDEPPRPRVVT